MEGGYQIIPLRHINLGAAPHTIKGIYRFIEDNVADKAALLEGLRISGTDYNSVFTTFEKDPETGIYHGSFIVDKEMYTLIVRSTDTVNVTHINIKTIQTNASDIYDVVADEWNASKTYNVDSYSIYNNTLWKCKLQNIGQTPAENSYWTAVTVGYEVGTINRDLAELSDRIFFEIYPAGGHTILQNDSYVQNGIVHLDFGIRFSNAITDRSIIANIPEIYRPKSVIRFMAVGSRTVDGYLDTYDYGFIVPAGTEINYGDRGGASREAFIRIDYIYNLG